MVLDICFCGCMIAIAVLTRAGTRSCGSVNDSPIGPGNRTSCQLQKVVFAVAVIGAVLFLLSIIAQVALSRSHKREKRYGPSPANNYTSGSGPAKRKPWQRKKKQTTHDAELGAVGAGALANGNQDKRASNLTGTTAPVTDNGYGGPNTKYAAPEPTLPAQHAGYTPHTTGVIDGGHAPHHSSGLIGGGRTSGVPEMESGVHGGPQYVEHDPNPYTEVHHGGYVHSHPESENYTR
ncbi:MAG: hypothetical protein Q9164_005887 [Protoblastenia rupestris]